VQAGRVETVTLVLKKASAEHHHTAKPTAAPRGETPTKPAAPLNKEGTMVPEELR
jgi:hypothetical protein